jgi:type III secretion protein W
MSKEFMSLASERYPSPEKVLQHGEHLGLGKDVEAKIITLSQFRDGVREMAKDKIYKSLQHRDDLYVAILDALEELEDEFDKVNEAEEAAEVDLNEPEDQEGVR